MTDPLAPQPLTADQVRDLVERTRVAMRNQQREIEIKARGRSINRQMPRRLPNGRFLSRNS